jgi:hypothetical protein
LKTFALLLLSLLGSGCVTTRTLTIGNPASVVTPPVTLTDETTWRPGELHVSVQASNTGGVVAPADMTAPLKEQLRDRLLATLVSQAKLGARTGPTTYVLELNLEAVERYGLGKGMGLAIALEVGLAALGAGLGALIGSATSSARPPEWLIGYSVGAGVGLSAGVVAATLPNSVGTAGEYKAHLVLRRLADRVPVGERHIDSAWRCDANFYGLSEKLARCSGEGFVEFEKTLLSGLQDLLLELQPAPAAAPAP